MPTPTAARGLNDLGNMKSYHGDWTELVWDVHNFTHPPQPDYKTDYAYGLYNDEDDDYDNESYYY